MKEITIKTSKIVRVEDSPMNINIPTEQVYYFQTGVRRSICITPKYTTWNKANFDKEEELYELNIICVYQNFKNKIEMFNISVSSIGNIYNESSNSQEKSIIQFLIDFSQDKCCERTKVQFLADLYTVINNINKEL
jgi:FAD synthase